MLPGLDAAFLYSVVAREKPERYIEIGSGTSTKFVNGGAKIGHWAAQK